MNSRPTIVLSRPLGKQRKHKAADNYADTGGLRRLTEDDVALGIVQRPPLRYPPLPSAPDTIIRECQRVQTLKMAQQGDGQKGGVARKQGKRVAILVSFKRVRDGAPLRNLAVEWQH